MCERENIISPPSLSHMPWFGNNGCYFLVVSALPHRITAWSVADRDFKQNHHDIITWRNDFLRDAIPLLLKRPGWQLSPQTAQLHRLVRMRHLMPDRCQRSHTSCRLYERWECLCVKPWVNKTHLTNKFRDYPDRKTMTFRWHYHCTCPKTWLFLSVMCICIDNLYYESYFKFIMSCIVDVYTLFVGCSPFLKNSRTEQGLVTSLLSGPLVPPGGCRRQFPLLKPPNTSSKTRPFYPFPHSKSKWGCTITRGKDLLDPWSPSTLLRRVSHINCSFWLHATEKLKSIVPFDISLWNA